MTGFDNPYASPSGEMHASVQYGGNAPAGAPTTDAKAPAAGPLIKDTTTAGFARDVLEESRNQPVLVDFWAPWCGPCKSLTPIIERVINDSHGRVKLVKMNIDDHPSVAGQLGIQSIPAVVAFVNGQPVDGFMGAVPEGQIRQFIDKVAGPAVDDKAVQIEAALGQAGELLAAGDAPGAADIYGAILQADPDNLKALAGISGCMVAAGQTDRARELLSGLTDEQKKDAGIAGLLKKLDHIEEANKLGDAHALEHELALHPENHASRMKLAKILSVQGDRMAAAEHLLYVMKADRSFEDDGARRQLLEFFDVWGAKDPATLQARRRLSSILFS
jgi:putative thioredoxin